MKPGIDIEIIGTIAIIRVDCGKLPPAKAEEHLKRTAKLFPKKIRLEMKVWKCIFIPYHN